MENLISSQSYRQEEIIIEKIENEDFEVLVSPEFVYEGKKYRVIIDGHHSYDAAIRSGTNPNYTEATNQDVDYLDFANENPEQFLEMVYMDTDWYFIESGKNVWA